MNLYVQDLVIPKHVGDSIHVYYVDMSAQSLTFNSCISLLRV